MVKPEPKIESGKQLLNLLDESDIKPTAFLWFYLSEGDTWRLIISSKLFDANDIKKAYTDFINKFSQLPLVKEIGLSNITLVPGDNDLLKLLRVALKTGKDGVSGIRFTSNTINNVFIEDAYIYRLA